MLNTVQNCLRAETSAVADPDFANRRRGGVECIKGHDRPVCFSALCYHYHRVFARKHVRFSMKSKRRVIFCGPTVLHYIWTLVNHSSTLGFFSYETSRLISVLAQMWIASSLKPEFLKWRSKCPMASDLLRPVSLFCIVTARQKSAVAQKRKTIASVYGLNG